MKSDKKVLLDASTWRNTEDFYDAFFRAVGAPDWHGRNFNALRDSIIGGQINEMELPYTIRITGLAQASHPAKEIVKEFCLLIIEFRSEGYPIEIDCPDIYN